MSLSAVLRPLCCAVITIGLLAVVAILTSSPALKAQESPTVLVEPSSAAPGEHVALRGSGWPSNQGLVARLYHRGASPSGPRADLTGLFSADANGTFEVQGTVPYTLFGSGNRGNVNVIPGQYAVQVQSGPELSATTTLNVGAPREGALLWGSVFFDLNDSGRLDEGDQQAAALVGITAIGPNVQSEPRRAITDIVGSYLLTPIPPGSYRLSAQTQFQEATWSTTTNVSVPDQQVTRADLLLRRETQTAPAVPRDERYFSETGFRIDNDQIWSYFNARGRVDIFGFPVSRTFTFLGCTVQVFQRQIAQVCADRGPALMNVLDPDIFPYTRVNFSTFPAPDEELKARTPRVGEPNYDERILAFVREVAPDEWQGMTVNFEQTFFGLITPEMAGTGDPGILGMLNLEAWGAPISHPARDPSNSHFIYQRFQRGIMHHIVDQGGTRGILLADYLKQIIRNSAELPPDLREQAQGSRFFAQYCPNNPNWLCRPDELTGTDLTFAFERG